MVRIMQFQNKLVLSLLLAIVIITSGCSDSSSQSEPTGPQPEVVQTNSERGVIDSLTNEATITATVLNRGEAGEVGLTIKFVDENTNVIGTSRKSIYMGSGERREVSFEVTIPDNAESYSISPSR